jgi:hypothetical protein
MSTTFAIFKIPVQTNEYGEVVSEYTEDDYEEVAVRTVSGIYWEEPFGTIDFALKDSVPVYPIDNTDPGIYTIGDIKKEIKRQLKGQKKKQPKPKRILNPGFLVWWSFWPKDDGFDGFEVTRYFPSGTTLMDKCERKYVELVKEFNEQDLWDALQYEIEWRKEKSRKNGKNELTFMSGPEPYLNQRKFEPLLGKKWKPKEIKTELKNPDEMFL